MNSAPVERPAKVARLMVADGGAGGSSSTAGEKCDQCSYPGCTFPNSSGKLTKSGLMHYHGRRGNMCPGSNHPQYPPRARGGRQQAANGHGWARIE